MHNRWHRDLEPIAAVAVGEELTLETEDGLAGQLGPQSSHADAGSLDLSLGHPLARPVHVQGAEPGDLLEVDLVAYRPAEFGVTALIPGFGYLADLCRARPFLGPPTGCGRSRRASSAGNLDAPQLVAGSRLLLPVDVPGALFSESQRVNCDSSSSRSCLSRSGVTLTP